MRTPSTGRPPADPHLKLMLDGRTLDFVKVPQRGKEEVLAAFAAHKGEVTEGYKAAA